MTLQPFSALELCTSEFLIGIIIPNVTKVFLEKKGRTTNIAPRLHTFVLYDFKYFI